ncbi:TPA: P-type conjugative transfer protein TrbL [Yersinia enterocolitica]|nr:P-type conjugative transfer protein TrbL [Yersinia enterocolitica]
MRVSMITGSIGLSLLLLAGNAAAAAGVDLAQSDTSMQGLLDIILEASNEWGPRLHGYAVSLFWSLALIQFVWTFFPMVFKQADFGELVGELIRFIMVIGFFLILLDHSTEWASAVVNSFRQAGAHAAGLPSPELMPGDMFATAVEFSRAILTGMSVFSPSQSIVVALAAILVLMAFAFIAAFIFVTLVEAYVVINASVLFMAFGASQWTREYTMAVIRYAVSVGAKLFMVTLIVGLILTVAKKWQVAYTNDEASLMTLVGLSLVCAYLTKTIPELIAGMINGVSSGGGSSIGGMAAAGVAGAAAAAATVATAGAAAPAGALGAAGSGASAAGVGGGGLAASINSSFAGGGAAGAGSGAASTGASSNGLGSSTGGSSAAKSAGAKVGGSASGGPSGSGPAPQPSQGVQQAVKLARKTAQDNTDNSKSEVHAQPQATPQRGQGGGSSRSAPQASQQPGGDVQGNGGGLSAHNVASVATRAAGHMAAMSVPGMEGAAGISLGTGTAQAVPDSDGDNADNGEARESANVIRGADLATASQAESGTKEADLSPNTQSTEQQS